jgi:hypothetical protein
VRLVDATADQVRHLPALTNDRVGPVEVPRPCPPVRARHRTGRSTSRGPLLRSRKRPCQDRHGPGGWLVRRPTRFTPRALTGPVTGDLQIAERTFRPCQTLSAGRPTFTESTRAGQASAASVSPTGVARTQHPTPRCRSVRSAGRHAQSRGATGGVGCQLCPSGGRYPPTGDRRPTAKRFQPLMATTARVSATTSSSSKWLRTSS